MGCIKMGNFGLHFILSDFLCFRVAQKKHKDPPVDSENVWKNKVTLQTGSLDFRAH